uniref:Small ribosomal subunit protein uS15m n=1 Tax=Ceriodaphnia reticulata TaxID=302197 RepID=A0A4Y7LYX2_9CRUS|nr:EOG090X09BQ [Ceriodaphnia reticulata]SVE73052.1 EOG090X09BQ [Ceriodaphnia reticulata]
MYYRIVPVIKPLTADSSQKCANFLNLLGVQTRAYKAAVNIEWVPPPKVSCLDPTKSGDRGTLPQVDLNRPRFRFSRVKPQVQFTERDDVPPEIRQLASIKFASFKEQIQLVKQDALAKVQRHVFDTASLESAIACLTIKIRNQQRHVKGCKRDVMSRVVCKENIEKRNSLLKHLRAMDYKRFEWLLEKLDLVYHPLPNPIVPVTRVGSVTKLASIYCDKVRAERLEAYKKELEAEKAKFVEEKANLQKWIEEEERELELVVAAILLIIQLIMLYKYTVSG